MSIFENNFKIMGAKISKVIGQVKNRLTATFQMVDMELINFYLKFQFNQDRKKNTIKLSQTLYINKILTKFYLA